MDSLSIFRPGLWALGLALCLSIVACGDAGGSGARAAGVASTAASAPPTSLATADAFTPVIASAHVPVVTPVAGSDGRVHLVYELRLANARELDAVLLKVEALDAASTDRILASVDGAGMSRSLRTFSNRLAGDARIPPNAGRLLLMHLSFASRDAVPARILHRLTVRGAGLDGSDPNPVDQASIAAPVGVDAAPAALIGPSLKGEQWIVINGCCEPESVHRHAALPVNGELRFAQRYAIDFMQLNARGQLLDGDGSQPAQYQAYGAQVLAVADGTVVAVLDTLDDQVPPTLPDPATVTLETADGNHVVLKLGEGLYAFYAHLQKGSTGVRVKLGETVVRGQVLGLLGNSGNSSAPHLHFHLMDGPSVLGSNGLPFAIDVFRQSGQASDAIADTAGLFSNFGQGLGLSAGLRTGLMPMDFAIVDFP